MSTTATAPVTPVSTTLSAPVVPSQAIAPAAAPISEAVPATPLAEAAPVVPATPLAEAVPAAPVEPAPAAPAAPATPVAEAIADFELELGESSPLTQEDLDSIAQESSDRGLNKEQAESLIKQRESFFSKGSDAAKAVTDARLTKDASAFNNDPDFVGDKRVESFASIRRVVQAFGDEGLTAALNDPYIGHSLPLAKFLKKLGDAMGADPIEGKGGSLEVPDDNSPAQRLKNLYPEHFTEN